METIFNSNNWISIDKISEGFSSDIKYRVIDKDNQVFLLRICSIEKYEKIKMQFKLLSKLKNMNTPKPISFGLTNNNKVYILLTWVNGVDAINKIKDFDLLKQYSLGVDAGKVLKKIHNLKPKKIVSNDNYKEKILKKINKFNELNYNLDKKDIVINYILDSFDRIKEKQITINHGDYHLGNMVIDEDKIGIVDFDKLGENDKYDDFKPFCWNVLRSPMFQNGLINGYFNNKVPDDFFYKLSVYAAESLISHLPWAIKFGEEEIKIATDIYYKMLEWYKDFTITIPTWYDESLINKNYVYMIRCKDNTLYTGWTNDLYKRIKSHNNGNGAKYTKYRGPVELVYYETFDNKSEALKREIEIKKLTRIEKLDLIKKKDF